MLLVNRLFFFCGISPPAVMASLSVSFLITAPLSVCLEAVETVFVQLFGSSTEETVYVFLKTSMAPDHRELSKDSLRLNSQNNYQGVAKVRVRNPSEALCITHLTDYYYDFCKMSSSVALKTVRVPRRRPDGFHYHAELIRHLLHIFPM